MFCNKDVLRNFAKLTGKHLCQSPFFNKVAGWGLTLLKKRLCGTGVFLWILWISNDSFSSKTLAVTGSGSDYVQCYWDHGRKRLANLNKQIVASTSNL